ncbi:Gfo/Idh/MocA family protein, partial [Bacteroidota bacterium]
MLKAAKRYDRVVQVGQWQRSDPHWMDAVNYVHSGKLGKIQTVKAWIYLAWEGEYPILPDEPVPDGVDYDFWLGPAPNRPFNKYRFHFTWRWFWDYAGGMMSDWGVHLLDYALFGMDQYVPNSVTSSGGKYAFPDDAREVPDTQYTLYEFDDFGLSWETTVGIGKGNYDRVHGVAFIGRNGTLVVNREGWEVIPEDYKDNPTIEAVPLTLRDNSAGSGVDHHVRNFLQCLKTREKPNANIDIAAHIARFSHMGNISLRTGRKLYWNPD